MDLHAAPYTILDPGKTKQDKTYFSGEEVETKSICPLGGAGSPRAQDPTAIKSSGRY